MRIHVLLVAALMLAGCTASPEPSGTLTPAPGDASRPATTTAAPPATSPPVAEVLEIRGIVVDPTIRPVAGASVRLVGDERTTTTDAGGLFRFHDVPDTAHVLQAHAPGFQVTNVTVPPAQRLDVRIVLAHAQNVTGYESREVFHGVIQCALEAFIITPSCDSALIVVPQEDRPFEQNYTFHYGVDLDWRTQVIDVVFDLSGNPGIDGLRVVLRGIRDDVLGGEYTQYGRFYDSQPFTIRLEPGGNYTDGIGPLPGNYTGFRLDVYPHSHGYHSVCDPRPDGDCFLGAAAGIDVEFSLYVTTFYGRPAPEGFTLRT